MRDDCAHVVDMRMGEQHSGTADRTSGTASHIEGELHPGELNARLQSPDADSIDRDSSKFQHGFTLSYPGGIGLVGDILFPQVRAIHVC